MPRSASNGRRFRATRNAAATPAPQQEHRTEAIPKPRKKKTTD